MRKTREYIVIVLGLLIGCGLCVICDNYVADVIEGRTIIQMVEALTRQERFKAIIANMVLFILGYCLVEACLGTEERWLKWLLSFPFGIFVWTCLSIICLLLGIPYNIGVMGVTIAAFMGIVFLIFLKRGVNIERVIRECAFFGVLTVILSSGILRNIVGNDTTFFNESYGYWLVAEEGFAEGLAVPILSTGLSVATLCSFFSMFGVDNMYLAQNIFRCLFIVIFYKSVENVCESPLKKKLALFGTVLLITSPAYSILSSWMVSNSFMMFELFMLVFFLFNLAKGKEGYLFPTVLLTFVISFTRVEGMMLALFVIVCSATLNINKKKLNYIIIPSIIAQIIYQVWCMKLNYQNKTTEVFISYKSVIILIAFMGAVFMFVQIKDKVILQPLMRMWGFIVIAMGVIGTIGLCVLDYNKYLYNLKITLQNILYLGKTGSWGMTPLLFIICILLVIATRYFDHFIDTLWMGYFILVLAICWSRESVLRISIADSGNRILIQIVPILVLSLMIHCDRLKLENIRNIEDGN